MDTQTRQVSIVSRLQLQPIPGAGRLMTKAYLAGDRYCKKTFGRLAHRWGFGPDVVAKQIWEQVEKDGILLELTDLDQATSRELKDKCRKLMEYALPYVCFLTAIAIRLTSFQGLRHPLLN
jgi:hypothetical protein